MQTLETEGLFRAKPLSIGIMECRADTQAVIVLAQYQITQHRNGDTWADCSSHNYRTSGIITVIKKDGSPNEVGVRMLMEGLGWDGDLDKLADGWDAPECEITVKPKIFRGETKYEVTWVSAIGVDASWSKKKMNPTAAKAKLEQHAAAIQALCSGAGTPEPTATPEETVPF